MKARDYILLLSGVLFASNTAADTFLVADEVARSVHQFDTDGSILPTFTSGFQPTAIAIGSDKNVYVTKVDNDNGEILKFNPTGLFLSIFSTSGRGFLSDIEFGPSGNLYASDFQRKHVLEFDGQNGSFLRVFASGNGLDSPNGITFGPDNNFYVTSPDISLK